MRKASLARRLSRGEGLDVRQLGAKAVGHARVGGYVALAMYHGSL